MNSSNKSKDSRLIKACKKCDFRAVQELIQSNQKALILKKHARSGHSLNHIGGSSGGGFGGVGARSTVNMTMRSTSRNSSINSNSSNNSEREGGGAGGGERSRVSRRRRRQHVPLQIASQLNLDCREAKFQMTPLMIACLRGAKDIALYLLEHGANIGLRDIKGNTALQLACMKQRFHVIDALLERHHANPNDVNMAGANCLISAVNYFHEDSAVMLMLLLRMGVRTEHKDNAGLMCIDHAVRKNKINAIRIILGFNPKLAQLCKRALVNAAIRGHFDIVLLLLDCGVEPNRVDIITGTAPLHEAVRYNDIRDEQSRLQRLKIVHYLALYGADPDLVNMKRETPLKLAAAKPQSVAEQYVDAMRAFYLLVPHRTPRFVVRSSQKQHRSQQRHFQDWVARVPDYPLLRPHANWTRNDYRFCSAVKLPDSKELVTNLIDGNPNSMWTCNRGRLNWVVFDFKADHCIGKLRIYGWRSPEMPRTCLLQASNSLDGPWITVHRFRCEPSGGSSLRHNGGGVPIDVAGFGTVVARFWRLMLVDNHGGVNTSLYGVEFFGYDYRVCKLLGQLQLIEYADVLVENDLNQIEALVNCTPDQFARMRIANKNDRDKLWNFLLEFQHKVQPLRRLDWFNEPVRFGLAGQSLPAFSVTSSAFLTNSLQLVAHGGGLMSGDTCVDMEPGGLNDPSMAIFRNIAFINSGKFIVEIRCLTDPDVHIASQPIQIFHFAFKRRVGVCLNVKHYCCQVEPGDPEYELLLAASLSAVGGSTPLTETSASAARAFNVTRHVDSDADDDDNLDQVYSFADFSNERTSKMKINKWLSKSQDFEEEAATYQTTGANHSSSSNGFGIGIGSGNWRGFFTKGQLPFGGAAATAATSAAAAAASRSPQVRRDLYVVDDEAPPSVRSQTPAASRRRKSSQRQLPSSGRAAAVSHSPAAVPRAHFEDDSPSLLEGRRQAQLASREYETQTFTIEFKDDESSASAGGDGVCDGFSSLRRSSSGTRPSCEARVFVNNPDAVNALTHIQMSSNNSNRQLMSHHKDSTPHTWEEATRVVNIDHKLPSSLIAAAQSSKYHALSSTEAATLSQRFLDADRMQTISRVDVGATNGRVKSSAMAKTVKKVAMAGSSLLTRSPPVVSQKERTLQQKQQQQQPTVVNVTNVSATKTSAAAATTDNTRSENATSALSASLHPSPPAPPAPPPPPPPPPPPLHNLLKSATTNFGLLKFTKTNTKQQQPSSVKVGADFDEIANGNSVTVVARAKRSSTAASLLHEELQQKLSTRRNRESDDGHKRDNDSNTQAVAKVRDKLSHPSQPMHIHRFDPSRIPTHEIELTTPQTPLSLPKAGNEVPDTVDASARSTTPTPPPDDATTSDVRRKSKSSITSGGSFTVKAKQALDGYRNSRSGRLSNASNGSNSSGGGGVEIGGTDTIKKLTVRMAESEATKPAD